MKRLKNTHRLKRLLILSALAIFCVGAARFTHFQTKGFRLSKVRHNFPLIPREEIARANPSCDLQTTLSQRFHFLGRGFQSFVFISEDGSSVLKLFNNRYQHQIRLFSMFSHLPFLHPWACQQRDLYTRKLENTFTSYEIAFDSMLEQTALEFLHLFPTQDLPPTITLVDPLHIAHQINPNETAFLLQKKVTLAYPALESFIEHHQIDEAKEALSSLLTLFTTKHKKALLDSDPLIRTNYGFIGTKAIQLDVGPLSSSNTPLCKEAFQKELLRVTASLKKFLTDRSPELSYYLDQELQDALSSLE